MRTPFRKSHGKITFVLYNRPHPCGGHCIYCFSVPGYTKSTTPNEDTELARSCNWSGKSQISERFRLYGLEPASGIKCDLAVKGDSFTTHDRDYMRDYVKGIYDFLNGKPSSSLAEACQMQKRGADRCATFKIETRPDQIDAEACLFFMELGITTVELGVQSLDDNVLLQNKRGHGTEAAVEATRLLRAYGFEVCYQVMVGLPGSDENKDYAMLGEKLWQEQFSPDALKIYPCLLLNENTAYQPPLLQLYNRGDWKPYSSDQYIRLLQRAYPLIPRYVHINRIQRIIPPEKIKAGSVIEIDRKIFESYSKCLWQRSVAQKTDNLEGDFQNYRIQNYPQGKNRVCFEALIQDETILGYGRLDYLSNNAALIRDVRVLGNMLPVGEKNNLQRGCQHIGIGTSLLKAMEEKAAIQGIRQLFVKPSYGTVDWFVKRGYSAADKYFLGKRLYLNEAVKETCSDKEELVQYFLQSDFRRD